MFLQCALVLMLLAGSTTGARPDPAGMKPSNGTLADSSAQDDGTTKITFGDQGPAPPAKTPQGPMSWPRLLWAPLPAAHEVITADGFDAQDVIIGQTVTYDYRSNRVRLFYAPENMTVVKIPTRG